MHASLHCLEKVPCWRHFYHDRTDAKGLKCGLQLLFDLFLALVHAPRDEDSFLKPFKRVKHIFCVFVTLGGFEGNGLGYKARKTLSDAGVLLVKRRRWCVFPRIQLA